MHADAAVVGPITVQDGERVPCWDSLAALNSKKWSAFVVELSACSFKEQFARGVHLDPSVQDHSRETLVLSVESKHYVLKNPNQHPK